MGIMGEYEQALPDCISNPAAWTTAQPGEYQNWKFWKVLEWRGWWRIPKWPYLNRGQDGKLLSNSQSSCSPINSGPKQRAPWALQRLQWAAPSISLSWDASQGTLRGSALQGWLLEEQAHPRTNTDEGVEWVIHSREHFGSMRDLI